MSQIQTTKLAAFVATGMQQGVTSPKVVAYVWAVPGDSGPDTSNKQGHVHTQIIRRG
jgi:hypothetical protein